MDLQALNTELLAGHPVSGAYNADHQLASEQINATDRSRIKASMSGSEMWANTAPAEYSALSDQKKLEWLNFCGIDSHSPSNNGLAHQFVVYIFGAGSDTLIALAAARSEAISRATELGLGKVRAIDIKKARAL